MECEFSSLIRKETMSIWDPLKQVKENHYFWSIPNAFNTGEFLIAPGLADESGLTMYRWEEEFLTFKVRKEMPSSAHINLPHELTVR